MGLALPRPQQIQINHSEDGGGGVCGREMCHVMDNIVSSLAMRLVANVTQENLILLYSPAEFIRWARYQAGATPHRNPHKVRIETRFPSQSSQKKKKKKKIDLNAIQNNITRVGIAKEQLNPGCLARSGSVVRRAERNMDVMISANMFHGLPMI